MSNALTIMDVVNSFKGELIFSFEYLCYGKASNEYFAVEDLADINEGEYFICAKIQFKDLVKELETNFGRSYSYQQYKLVFKQMTSEAKAKPVFTQAMADAGESPKVGMECLVEMIGAYLPVTITYNSEHVIAFTYKTDNGLVETCKQKELNHVKIKPTDQRTDKEKAFDYMKFSYEKGNNMEDVLSEIIKGYVTGVKWVGE